MLAMGTASIDDNPVIRLDKQHLSCDMHRLLQSPIAVMPGLHVIEIRTAVPVAV